MAHTDHKPLIGLQKKIHLTENQRLLSMVLATTEFSFELKYLPGKKNVRADYGTRHIPDTDWPVEQEDPLELSDLFPFLMVSTILEYPDISSEDFEEITSAGFTLSEQDNYFTVEIKGKQKIFIPKSIRRAIFWATHFPLHTGIRLTLNSLREKDFYWQKLEEDIQKFLSQCVCATKKTDKFKRKPHGQGICATHVLQICAIDLYEYNSEHYFTLLDLFSEFPFCTKIASEEASEVKLAYDKFCSSYATPESLFSDNGKEFALMKTERNTTPANFPRPNGKIERFHRELGKLSRIHDTIPDNAAA